jgi:ribosomal protein S18 acetylase RimI-like enzyme
MNIKIPTINNFEKVTKIAKQVHDLHVNWRPDLFKPSDTPILKDEFAELVNNKSIYVAQDEDKIIGYVIFNIKEQQKEGYPYRKVLHLDVVGVDESCRGKGVGQKLIKFLLEVCKDNDFTDFELTVSPENEKAIKFYEELGMKVKNIKYQMNI